MTYMHICSAFCATGVDFCCSEGDEGNNCEKSCSAQEEKSANPKPDCQDLHFSFFNATGQYAFAKSIDTVKVFFTIVQIVTPILNILPVSHREDIFAFNGFHPPPPKSDIRIFINSFLI